MITGVKLDPFLASCPPNCDCYWQWKEQWKDLWECKISYQMELCQDSGHPSPHHIISHHHITSRQNRLQTLSSKVELSQIKKPTCFPNASVPSTCHSNVSPTYHLPELLVSPPEAKILHLSYLPYNKVTLLTQHKGNRTEFLRLTYLKAATDLILILARDSEIWDKKKPCEMLEWTLKFIQLLSFPYCIYFMQTLGWPTLTTCLTGGIL